MKLLIYIVQVIEMKVKPSNLLSVFIGAVGELVESIHRWQSFKSFLIF